MSVDTRREERRLRKIFLRAAWLAVATPIAAIPFACGSQVASSTQGAGGGAASGSSAKGSASASNAASSGSAGDVTSSGSAGGTTSTSTSTSDAASSSSSAGGGDPSDAGADAADPGDAGDAAVSDAAVGDASCAAEAFTPDPPDMCGAFFRLPCGLPPGTRQAGDCFLFLNDCAAFCPENFFYCFAEASSCADGGITGDPTGAVTIDCVTCPLGAGRVPAGLARAQVARAPSALGDYFSATAHLEAASVHAFRRLHRELAAHRAPARLLRATRRAQRDEVGHAQRTGRMARRFGGAPVRPVVKALAPRALDAVAIENAVEGCIRETFGALVASFQAAHAQDAGIARLMGSIARDETRHAALSWAISRWAWGQLDAAARARLVAHCQEAIEALRRDADAGVADVLVARAGLPNAEQHRSLVRALEEQLWTSLRA